MNQAEFLRTLTENQHPMLDSIAAILTFLGNEEFYFLIVPIIYWCVQKQAGFRLFYIFLVSVTINAFLKITYAIQRPIGVEGVHSLFISSAEVGSHYPNDSFPSGHAQGSTTLWGYLAYLISRPTFWVFAVCLILLISFSRIYTGLHWPTDVIAGIMIAVFILIVAIRIQHFLSTIPAKAQWSLAILIPLFFVAFFPEEEGAKYAGFLLGAGIGYLIEGQKVNMLISNRTVKKISAYAIGIIGLFALQIGLKFIFPEHIVFDFIRYSCIGLWGLLGAPYMFVKLGIYETNKDIQLMKGNVSV
ncbi:phosphatase PAP2 family protein [Halalkalibacter krulwichiae]|uniref:Undecaprenyl pyrophosphate phosphatase n=1 Tax=Halalkalibacter krulwichiae TaxID=199441 RepID=A0A1X9MJV9_9BACI|nr:phosphatase PAP2 family protein [Halalkalibacter krulwichiae]ARK30892.1 undecaprenyl pyrophosphate phosphatase [Halalkalibacter krulwichiae]